MSGLKIKSVDRRRLLSVLLPVLWTCAAHAEPPSPCQSAQLLATEDRKESDGIDGGLGHHAMTLAILNHSSTSCVLQGVPTLGLSYTATRVPFPVTFCSNCVDYLFPRQPIEEILLEPKRSAYVVLGYNINDGNGKCTEDDPKFLPRSHYSVMTLSLFLPGQHQSPMKISFDEWRNCGAIDVTPFLKQPPVDSALPGPADQKK